MGEQAASRTELVAERRASALTSKKVDKSPTSSIVEKKVVAAGSMNANELIPDEGVK
jgi:hypothetical protein